MYIHQRRNLINIELYYSIKVLAVVVSKSEKILVAIYLVNDRVILL